MKEPIVGAIWIAILLAIGIPFTFFMSQREELHEISIRNQIEESVEVQGLENKFSIIRMSFYSGAGAGGLGAPQIFTKSIEQFVKLIPSGERIYVSLEYGKTDNGYEDRTILKKIYWAFIENRAGLIIYEDLYERPGWRVKGYDNISVTFHRFMAF